MYINIYTCIHIYIYIYIYMAIYGMCGRFWVLVLNVGIPLSLNKLNIIATDSDTNWNTLNLTETNWKKQNRTNWIPNWNTPKLSHDTNWPHMNDTNRSNLKPELTETLGTNWNWNWNELKLEAETNWDVPGFSFWTSQVTLGPSGLFEFNLSHWSWTWARLVPLKLNPRSL